MSDTQKAIIKELGAGLILRRSSPADADALSAFCGMIHSEVPGGSDDVVVAWTRDLLTRPHPTFHPDDFTVVEEASTGRIVSTLNLIPQTWTYEGIPFKVGRPELVGTLPEFRNRGLVRKQFDVIHQWSADRGEMVQAITGIPFYYRLFGYEMALDLDGTRSGFELNLPHLKDGESEPYSFRRAGLSDIAFLEDIYNYGCTRSPVSCQRDSAIWHYEFTGRSEFLTSPFYIIERPDGSPVGFLKHPLGVAGNSVAASVYELIQGASWLEVTPGVARYLWKTSLEYSIKHPSHKPAFTFALGEAHPVYEAFKERLPDIHHPYAWYMRVPDLPAFIRHISPALEKRLADSLASGYTGLIRVSFYRSGIRLTFKDGSLVGVDPWMPDSGDPEGDIAFPGLTFLQLLFGYRSLDDLRASFADCLWKTNETRALFNALFPKKPSQVYALS